MRVQIERASLYAQWTQALYSVPCSPTIAGSRGRVVLAASNLAAQLTRWTCEAEKPPEVVKQSFPGFGLQNGHANVRGWPAVPVGLKSPSSSHCGQRSSQKTHPCWLGALWRIWFASKPASVGPL